MAHCVDLYVSLVRNMLKSFRGTEVHNYGDILHLLFASVRDAIAVCLRVQVLSSPYFATAFHHEPQLVPLIQRCVCLSRVQECQG